MNDADLEKLAIKPGKLEPNFNRNVTNYSVTLPSTVTKLNVNPLTRDSDASWTVVGHGCTRTLPITPGEQKTVIIEVTAEDGSTKQYSINITSLSPSDVALSGIKLSIGNLSPDFKSNLYEYSVAIPWFTKDLTVLPESKDKDVGGANAVINVDLDYGPSITEFGVFSPDKSCSKTYKLKLIKAKILRATSTVDAKLGTGMYCPLCLGLLHCPVSLKSLSPLKTKTLYCKECVENLIRTRKIDPFEDVPLQVDCVQEELEYAKAMSSFLVKCCYSQNGCTDEVTLKDLGNHMKNCQFQPFLASKFEGAIVKKQLHGDPKVETEACKMCSHAVRRDEIHVHLTQYCPAQQPNTRINHVVELRSWERKLQEVAIGDVAETSEDFLKPGKETLVAFEDLEAAAVRYAALIKMKPREFTNHFKLALVFEEMYYAKDVWGNKQEAKSNEEEDDKTLDNLMDMASDSSKEDDITALCEARGVSKDAPLSSKLKAIDEEYHSLLDQNQSAKADYVQKLYVWKSKQSVGTKNSECSAKDETFLGKAFLKYQDACACSPNNWMLHMHVGRHLLMQGKYEDAIQRLEAAFGLKPTSIEARFYIGLAYAKHFGRHQKHLSETIKYLQDGCDFVLLKLLEEPDVELPRCSAEIFVRNSNVLLLEGMLELGNLLKETRSASEKERTRIIDTYRQTSVVCFHFLNNMLHRNETYNQLLWALIRAHFALGLFMTKELKKQSNISTAQKQEMQCYWERLSALAKALELPMDHRIMNIQRKICEEAVSLCPSSSQALFRLGDIQLTIHDQEQNNNEEILKDAEYSYRASIELEGKPAHSSEVSLYISDCDWWKQKKSAENHQKHTVKQAAGTQAKLESFSAKKQVKSTTTPKGTTNASNAMPGKPIAASKTTTSAQKTTMASKNTSVTSKTATSRGPVASSKSTAAAPKVTGTVPKSTAAAPKTTKGSQLSSPRKATDSAGPKKSDPRLSKSSSSHHATSCATQKAHQKKDTAQVKPPAQRSAPEKAPPEQLVSSAATVQEEVILNKVSYQPRLGLARILSRGLNNFNKAEVIELYEKVIEIAPHIHDAYIELGGLLAKSDPQEAVKIYSKFPFGPELSFDDAYLHGEIVRILMNSENFENPNLERSMIAYGTVMGLTVLDKHVSVLESKFKFKVLRNVYAGVNKKDVNDDDLQQFFKFKCWV